MRARRTLLAGLAVLLLAALGDAAEAQTAPALPDPVSLLPLDDLAPVLELIGPATSPVCGGVGIVVFLSPAVLTQLGPLGAPVLPALGPVLTLCGAIPSTDSAARYTCALDEQSQAALADLLIPLAGIGPVVDIRPAGLPLDQVQVILDALPPEVGLQQLLTQVTTVLQCRQGNPEEAAPSTTLAVDDAVDVLPPPPPLVLPVAEALAPLPLPAVVPAVRTPVAPRPAAVTRTVPHVPFSYAGVFLVPFALLAAVAWYGRSLARPLRQLPADRSLEQR
jgi:hypothetical protein